MIPSDEDLNCLLKAWTVPPSPDSLERRLRRAYRERTGSQSRRWFRNAAVWTPRISGFAPAAGTFAGITAGAIVFLLVMAEAFPQSLAGLSGTTFPFTVDYEEIEHKANGSSVVIEYFTAAPHGVGVLSSEFPGDPLRTAQQRILDPLNLVVYWITTPLRERDVARQEARINALKAKDPNLAERLAERERTCAAPGDPWSDVGKQTILNYATTEVQKEWMEEGKPVRFTEWSAPDLHCFVLKSTTEKTFDGRFRLAYERRALKVTMNAPAARPPATGHPHEISAGE